MSRFAYNRFDSIVLLILLSSSNLMSQKTATNFSSGLMQHSTMVDLKGVHRPSISYRPIRPSDLEVLEKIHCDLFLIRSDDFILGYLVISFNDVEVVFCNKKYSFSFHRYKSKFFHDVVNGKKHYVLDYEMPCDHHIEKCFGESSKYEIISMFSHLICWHRFYVQTFRWFVNY